MTPKHTDKLLKLLRSGKLTELRSKVLFLWNNDELTDNEKAHWEALALDKEGNKYEAIANLNNLLNNSPEDLLNRFTIIRFLASEGKDWTQVEYHCQEGLRNSSHADFEYFRDIFYLISAIALNKQNLLKEAKRAILHIVDQKTEFYTNGRLWKVNDF